MIYARRGERITCEAGHEIATFNRDADRNDVFQLDMVDWRIEPPPPRKPAGNCPCGAAWNASRDDGLHAVLHIEGGWRD
jgi:hypothetical protein